MAKGKKWKLQHSKGKGIAEELNVSAQRPAKYTLFRGYPGKSALKKHQRLYLTADLSCYVDIPNYWIAHSEEVPVEIDPLRAFFVWVHAGAELSFGEQRPSASAAAMYCVGAIQDKGRPCDQPVAGEGAPESNFGYTSPGMPTCGGKATCNCAYTDMPGSPTCGGKATCNCAYTDMPGSPTCGGKATCNCAYTDMPGSPTCGGKATCNCAYTDMPGSPTCGGKATCNCGYSDTPGMPTCGGKATCNC